jgi:hypothetical protein
MAIADCVAKLLSEDVISLKEAHRELEQVLSQRMDRSTVHRWALRGVRGCKLDHVRIGGKMVTSKQALTRFISELTSQDSQQ